MQVAQAISDGGGLVNISDMAREWKLSRSRVRALVDKTTFPAPVGVVAEDTARPMKVWLWNDVSQWRGTR